MLLAVVVRERHQAWTRNIILIARPGPSTEFARQKFVPRRRVELLMARPIDDRGLA